MHADSGIRIPNGGAERAFSGEKPWKGQVSRLRTAWLAGFMLLASIAILLVPNRAQWVLGPGSTLAVTGGTLIDGTGSGPVPGSVVVIAGGRILAAGPRATVEVPSNATVLDARGKWVIPGLIDAHVHYSQSGGLYTRPDVIDLREMVSYEREMDGIRSRLLGTFRRYLCSGVTATVDVGGPFWNFEVRDVASRTALAPRIAVAGPLVSTYEPHILPPDDPDVILAENPEAARELVRRQLSERPDLVKVWFVLGPGTVLGELVPTVEAAITESHAGRVRAAVHAMELETAKEAVRAGADILVHGVSDQPVDEEFMQMVRDRGVIYTTTLGVFEGYAKVLSQQVTMTDADRTCGDPAVIGTWDDLAEMGYPPGYFAGESQSLRIATENLKRMQDVGVIIAAGTDAGNIGTLHGPAVHREFELMAAAGLTPMEILVAATSKAARVFHGDPEMGTIAPGKLADLVILDADPLADIRNARRINTVIKAGRVFGHAALTAK